MLYWLRADEWDSKLLTTSKSLLSGNESVASSGSTLMKFIVFERFKEGFFFSYLVDGSGLKELLRLTE